LSSVVLELQRDALDRTVPISDLLRKALVVARKLKISEFESWINNELNGYEKTEDIPKQYRLVRGSVKAWNPSRGWQPVVFPEYEVQEALSKRLCNQSIAEIESLVSKDKKGSLHMPYPARAEQQLRKAIDFDTEVTLIVPNTSMVRIVDAVRTIVLNWSLKLEEDGILGEGMSFTPVEREKAEKTSYNINNFYGPVQSPQIQQQTSQSIQISRVNQFDLDAVQGFLRDLQSQVSKLNLKQDLEQEIEAEVKTVEAQISSPKPKHNVIRESLNSVRKILEGAGGNLAAQLLVRLGPLLLNSLSN
jgi:hypothetical protein